MDKYVIILRRSFWIFLLITFCYFCFFKSVFLRRLWGLWIIIALLIICIGTYRCYFLRQPTRFVPDDENLFVSPANGEIFAIIKNPTKKTVLYKENRKVLDNFIEGIGSGATMVSIKMTPANVHYQRSPNNAELIEQVYVYGKKHNAIKNVDSMKSTLQNEYNAMLFEMDNGVRYKIIQIAGSFARRIVSFVDVDDEVEQGEVIGLIKFGSQVTIIFDSNVEVIANVGDKVIDGETILAKIKDSRETRETED